jgi:hypothetical protein
MYSKLFWGVSVAKTGRPRSKTPPCGDYERHVLDTRGTGRCRACSVIHEERYRKANRARKAEWYREWRKKNPEKAALITKKNKLKKIGWTWDEYCTARENQAGRCFICGVEEELEADHCHRTGRRRHLLCGRCNRGLTFFHDDPRLLLVAAQYVTDDTLDAVVERALRDKTDVLGAVLGSL